MRLALHILIIALLHMLRNRNNFSVPHRSSGCTVQGAASAGSSCL